MARLGSVSRRWMLSLLAGALVAPAVARSPARKRDTDEKTLRVGAWILRADDLEKSALHAA